MPKFLKNSSDSPLAARRARPPIARMLRIHEFLSSGDYPNCTTLSEVFEVSYKTVQRDIDFMRDQLLLPIDYDQTRHGFRYTKPVSQFPLVKVSQGELVSLLVAQKALEQYRGTSFEAPLRSAFDKLASGLDDKTSVSLRELSRAVSFRPSGIPVAELRTFDILADAVLTSRVVEFSYLSPRARKAQRRRVEPLHLSCIAGQWYLLAHDQVRGARRTFSLPRIRRPKNLRKPFRRPSDFSAEKMLADSFSAFESRQAEVVRIRLTPFAARLAAERKWHPSQKLKKQADGGAEISLKVGLAPDLTQWILGWGDQAEVLAPDSLRRDIAAMISRMAGLYPSQSAVFNG